MAQDQLKRLQNLKSKFNNAKMEKNRWEGKLETFYDSLEKRKIKDVKQAESKVNELEKKVNKINGEVESILNALEEEFDIWEKDYE